MTKFNEKGSNFRAEKLRRIREMEDRFLMRDAFVPKKEQNKTIKEVDLDFFVSTQKLLIRNVIALLKKKNFADARIGIHKILESLLNRRETRESLNSLVLVRKHLDLNNEKELEVLCYLSLNLISAMEIITRKNRGF